MTNDALQTHLDELRLGGAIRVGCAALALSCLAPQAVVEGQYVSIVDLSSDVSALHAFVALLSPVASAFLLAATAWVAETLTIATFAAGSMSVLVVMTWVGATLDPEASIVGYTHRSIPFVASVAISIAALLTSHNPNPFRVRALLLGAGVLAVFHGLFALPDEAPWLAMAKLAKHLLLHPHPGAIVSATLLGAISLWPVWVILFAWRWVSSNRPPIRYLTLQVCLGAPSLAIPIAFRSLLGQRQQNDLAVSLGEALCLGGVLLVGSTSIAFLLNEGPQPRDAFAKALRSKKLALGSLPVVIVSASALWLGRPKRTVSTWALENQSPAALRLFSNLLPTWNDQRALVDLKGGKPTLVSTQELFATAHEVDAQIEGQIKTLDTLATDRKLTLRRWTRRIEGMNERLRRMSIPYYIDPTQMIGDTYDDSRRWYRLDTYKIERVHQFEGADHPRIALHVRALTPDRSRRGLLGLSRDAQRFAIVLPEDIAIHASELQRVARVQPARCVERTQANALVEEAVVRCGALLVRASTQGNLGEDLLGAVERHELQHQIDSTNLREAKVISRRFSRLDLEIRRQLNRELSAHLAEMSASGVAPSITLARALRLALLPDQGSERPVAYLMLEALAEVETNGGVDEMARVFLDLVSDEDDVLRARAIKAWKTQFGGELPSLRRVAP